jgi:hypothetical protein
MAGCIGITKNGKKFRASLWRVFQWRLLGMTMVMVMSTSVLIACASQPLSDVAPRILAVSPALIQQGKTSMLV